MINDKQTYKTVNRVNRLSSDQIPNDESWHLTWVLGQENKVDLRPNNLKNTYGYFSLFINFIYNISIVDSSPNEVFDMFEGGI